MDREWPLVGRGSEIEAARRALDDLGALVVIGPMGVGKSRLLAEVVALVADAGTPVTAVTATPATAAIPFEALRHLLGGRGAGSGRPADEVRVLEVAVERAGASGGVIAVDDAHLLDDQSAALLHRIVTDGRAPVVATVRSGEPVPDAVTALWKDGGAARLELGPLDLRATGALAAVALAEDPGPRRAEELWRRTGGNPLFLVELLAGTAGSATHPADVVAERLDALDAAQRAAVDVVAVAEPAPLALVDDWLEPLEALEARGVVTVDGRDHDATVRFCHPLYGEVARAALADRDRARLARSLAARLLDDPARTAGTELRVCTLLASVGLVPEPALAVPGARQALARGDADLARTLAEGAAGDADADACTDAYEATMLLADLDWFAGDVAGAEAGYARVDRLVTTDAQVVEVAVARARLYGASAHDKARAREVVEDARARVEDPAAIAELEAGTLLTAHGYETVTDVSRRLLDHPDLTPLAEWSTVLFTGWAATQFLQVGEARRLSDLGRRQEHRFAGDRPVEVDMLAAVAVGVELAAGNLAVATDLGWDRIDRADPDGQVTGLVATVLAQAEWVRGRWARAEWVRGRWARAGEALDLALDQVRALDQFQVLHVITSHVAMVAVARDDRAGARAALDAARSTGDATDPFGQIWVARAEAWCHLLDGDVEAAVAALVRGGRDGVVSNNWGWAALALHDAVCLGAAAEVVDDLRAATARAEGAHLFTALLAHAQAAAGDDGAGLAGAAARLDAMGARGPAAAAWAQAAAALDADDPAACRAATRARALARDWDPLPPVVPRPPAGPALTGRQHEVARLAADGLPSQAIADRLGVSVRTVDNHLGAAYRRTGLAGRAELAALVG